MEIIKCIQEWYSEQCDGDWEHSYGIKIETLDNPVWSLEIDVEGTILENFELKYSLVDNGEDDWYGFKIEEFVLCSRRYKKVRHLTREI